MFTSTSSPRRKTDSDRRDRESPRSSKEKEKDKKHRPSSSRKVSSSSTKDRDRDRERDRSPGRERKERRPEASHSASRPDRKMAVVPEMERRPSIVSPRISSYPSFSKAHSKEAVGSRDDVVNPRLSLYTPDPTDLGSDSRGKGSPDYRRPTPPHGAGPPSPPLTTTEPDLRRTRSENRIRKPPSNIRIVSPTRERKSSMDSGQKRKTEPRRPGSTSTLRHRRAVEVQSEVQSEASSWTQSSASEGVQEKGPRREQTDLSSSANSPSPAGLESTAKSQTASSMSQSTATSVASPRKSSRGNNTVPIDVQSSPLSAPDSSPRTPTPHDSTFPQPPVVPKDTPAGISAIPSAGLPSPYSVQSSNFGPPINNQSPPPPPPAPVPINVPRVDYLLQNGGLPHVVPRRFFSVVSATTPLSAQYPNFSSPQTPGPQRTDISAIFSPFQSVLDDYLQVMSKNGSLAVATGYRSVARRLLDRLEAVFNRNISSETCNCVMCHDTVQSEVSTDEDTGLSWGEILEYVSGRRELSHWPPFVISSDAPKPSLAAVADAPMQKLDMDIPPEYRDHYIRQSKKTKDVVQAWLKSQPEVPSSPPQEVDNETLIFAMVTHLEPTDRKLFTALLRGMSTLPETRAPTPAAGMEQSDLMKRTALALQRLYRLQQAPRDAECAIYLLKNPQLHGVLATLAVVSNGEWEILISGRFDGFLWSGAESPIDSRLPSRGPTPASASNTPGLPSRGPTPSSAGMPPYAPMSASASSFGAPVQIDEETEIAVLAEVEREIYAGMDALEDAFEALHARAEQVREALRLRNAGLSLSASARNGSFAYNPEARLGTPNTSTGIWEAMGREDEDWIDDGKSEIRPDDSASNISYNRRRRRHREKERRTPAPVEEEDEESVITEDYQPRRR